MGYVPPDAEWYLADLLMEITVQGARSNVLHRNLTLVHAGTPGEAYQRATQLGYEGETSYDNPEGQLVKIKFRGIAKLEVVDCPLEDGAELLFEEHVGISSSEIEKLIPKKEELSVFVKPTPGAKHDPDYRSGAVLDNLADKLMRSGGE